MAFSWFRTVGASRTSRAQRRRSGGLNSPRDEDPQDPPRVVRERVHKRWSWSIGGVLILVVVAVLAAGYYQEFYKPPRVWAGQVNDVRFTMGDLVQRIRVEQGLVGQVDLGRRPFDYLKRLLDVEVLRQKAPELGINISDDLVEQALLSQFHPTALTGQATDPGQLDQEYRNNLQIFLTRTGLSENEFRGIMEEGLRLSNLHFLLGRDIEENQEQVEVEWIRLDARGQVKVQEVTERLQYEEFASVAQNVGVPGKYADSLGYVGWLPRQAFPEIGRVVFGDTEAGEAPLDVGEIALPIYIGDHVYIVRKISGPEPQPLSDIMGDKINTQLVDEWQTETRDRGLEEGWLQMQFNSKLYEWVADQVLLTAPRSQPGQR